MTTDNQSPTAPEPEASKTWPDTDYEREAFVSWQYCVGNGDTLRGFRDYLKYELEEDMGWANDPADPHLPLDKPMSLAELKAAVDGNDAITALVPDPQEGDFEDQLDKIAEAITGSVIGLTDINIENERVLDDGTLILKVTATVMFDDLECDDTEQDSLLLAI